jgi:hypothetical protein
MSYGMTDEGFVVKPQSIIDSEVDQALRDGFGNFINTLPQSVFGQLKSIFAEREALLWEGQEQIYLSQYPSSAEGVSLDDCLAINGLRRLGALESSIVGQALFGTASTVIPAGTQISKDGDPDVVFETDEEVTLGAGVDEVQTIAFAGTPASGTFKLQYTNYLGDSTKTATLNWDDNAATIQAALRAISGLEGVVVSGSIAAGLTITFSGVSGKRPQLELTAPAVDNALLDAVSASVVITITETTPGEFQATVDMTATETGPKTALAGTLTEIDTPVSGLESTYNPNDAVSGRDEEEDSEARVRREQRLQQSLAGPTDAIRAAILELNDIEGSVQIEACRVFENKEFDTDIRGIPGKAIRAYVYQAGGATTRDDEIGQAIYDSKGGGIKADGDISVDATDSEGFSHSVGFSRPDEKDIYLDLTLTVKDADGSPTTLTTAEKLAIEEDIVTWGNDLGVGKDVVVYPSLVSQIPEQVGEGSNAKYITDVVVDIGTAPGPSGDANVVIDDGSGGDFEMSRWDSSRISIS